MKKIMRNVGLIALAGAVAACGSQDPGKTNGNSVDDDGPSGGGGARATGGRGGTGGGGAGATGGGTGGAGGTGGTGAAAGGGSGGASPADGGATPDPLAPYLPFKVGNSWKYKVTDRVDGTVSMKTNVLEAMEAVGGRGPNATKMAIRAKTIKTEMRVTGLRTDWVVSWQGHEGTGLVRYRELGYQAVTGGGTPMNVTYEMYWEPWKLRLEEGPERTAAGATWVETYKETKQPVGALAMTTMETDYWKVEAVDVPCSVPDKPPLTCIKLRKSGTSTDDGKTYWFARGVGKVREEGRPPTGQVEELVDYTIVP
jgi:hypothetical protein